MDFKNLLNVIQELPYQMPLDQALDYGLEYLTEDVIRIKTWFDIVWNPWPDLITHHYLIESWGKDSFIGFIVTQQATFLPDIVSEGIQICGGINVTDDILNLIIAQRTLLWMLRIFVWLCELRMSLNFWLNINPYTLPWYILLVATDWALESVSGVLPGIMGIEFTGIIVFEFFDALREYLENLVFTMPYLPSEAIEETIGIHKVYRFSGIPKLWYKYGIPDDLREEWYQKRPDILEHLIKTYGHLDLDFVPSRVLEQFYKNHIESANLSSSIDFVTTNILSYKHHFFHIENFF